MSASTPVSLQQQEEQVQAQDAMMKKAQRGISGSVIALISLAGIWALLGVAAFIASIVCFAKSGTLAEKVLGLILAIFIGPFYWLYFLFMKGYCGKVTSKK